MVTEGGGWDAAPRMERSVGGETDAARDLLAVVASCWILIAKGAVGGGRGGAVAAAPVAEVVAGFEGTASASLPPNACP